MLPLVEPLARTLPLLVALAACNARGVSFVPKADAADDLSSPDDVTHADVAPDRATPRDATSDEGLPGLDVAPRDVAGPPEASVGEDVTSVYDVGGERSDACAMATCAPRPDGCGPRELCGNGLDDNCNGMSDEGCPCVPGTVQDCFLGPPGRRRVGACRDGAQRCLGTGEFGNWSACGGGISPSAEVCDSLDNDCNGCDDDGLCCRAEITCPAPGDARVPDGRPFAVYPLRGDLFYAGDARSWRWQVRGGPCDALLPTPTFTTRGLDGRDASFTPTLSGDYTVTLTVVTAAGTTLTCTFVVHIAGPGLRVELCWDTSTTVDLDLYVHSPRNTGPWFDGVLSPLFTANLNSCNWSNCEAEIRGTRGRSDWGFGRSPIAACESGPHGAEWRALVGACPNPRLDIDNNLVKATGVPENINVDAPREGDRFRVMVQNFTGTAARPLVNVYCGGRLRATVGAAPDTLPDFTGPPGASSIGAMWRALDVVTHADAMGITTGCDVTPLHPPGRSAGFFVTRDDPSY
jgi:hypothetical protein